MFNIFSIIGLWIAMQFVRTGKRTEEADLIIEKIKQKKYYSRRKIGVLLYYIIIFPFISAILNFPNWISGLRYDFKYGFDWNTYFVPVVFLLFAISLILLRIKKEDIYLFDELKNNNQHQRRRRIIGAFVRSDAVQRESKP